MRAAVFYIVAACGGGSAWTCRGDVALFQQRLSGVSLRAVAPTLYARRRVTGLGELQFHEM